MDTKYCFATGSNCTAETAGPFVSRIVRTQSSLTSADGTPNGSGRVHDDARVEVDQAHRLPAELQRQHAAGDVVERPQVVGVDRPSVASASSAVIVLWTS